MRTILVFFILTAAAVAQSSTATTTTTAATTTATRPLWKITLPGGAYQVLVSAMLSVSQHEYIVDGSARVTEVNIDTSGSLTVRFYYIEPAQTAGPGGIGAATLGKVQNILTDAAERSGSDSWKKVVKSYPVTTHARTIEYRIGSKDSLTKIFTSASNSQGNGKADTVTVSD